MKMKNKWNKYIEPKRIPRSDFMKKYLGNIRYQNAYQKIDYEPVDINRLFRSDGMIHVCR